MVQSVYEIEAGILKMKSIVYIINDIKTIWNDTSI